MPLGVQQVGTNGSGFDFIGDQSKDKISKLINLHLELVVSVSIPSLFQYFAGGTGAKTDAQKRATRQI
jgi:hypothetical protein